MYNHKSLRAPVSKYDWVLWGTLSALSLLEFLSLSKWAALLIVFAVAVRFIAIVVAGICAQTGNLASTLLIDVSLFSVPAAANFAGVTQLSSSNLELIYSTGMMLYILQAIVNLGSGKQQPAWRGSTWSNSQKNFATLVFPYFVCLTVGLSIASYFLGITVMGVAATQLPFRLTGALNILRIFIIPCVFLVFVDIAYEHSGQRARNVVIAFCLWSMLEAAVRLSKGALLESFLLLATWACFRGIPFRRIAGYAVVAVLFGAASYRAIDFGRSIWLTQGQQLSAREVVEVAFEGDTATDSFIRVFARALPNGLLLAKFADALDYEVLRSRVGDVIAVGSPAMYHTRAIDGFSATASHSSGSASLAEAHLLFGQFGAVAIGFVFILVFRALQAAPRQKQHKSKLIYAYGTYVCIHLYNNGVIEYILSPFWLQKSVWPLCIAILAVLTRSKGKGQHRYAR